MVMMASLAAALGGAEALEVPCPPYYNSNTEWWLYQFDGYPDVSNHNCGPACTAMVINYLRNKGVTTSYHQVISSAHPNVHCHARLDYCEQNGVPGGYADSDWSEPGATYGQIQNVLFFEGIESHVLTGSACDNDGAGIANVKGAIDQGKLCICKVAPMYYRDVGYFSHWTVVYGYDENSIYLNDAGYSAPPSGQGFQAEVSRFADALWKLSELQVIIVIDTRFGPARTWCVDASVTQSGDGKTWGAAFKTIQEGIDAAAEGDTVIAAPGTYVENIHFNGKNIVLQSTDVLDQELVANAVIDGNQAGSVVTFGGTEDETCVLAGFTIRNGKAEDGGGICGGTWEHRARATIRDNVITGNYAVDYGGGLAYCDGAIRNNVISSNYGRGLDSCDATIENNIITGNSGNGLSACSGTIQNNTITRNDGGGLLWCDGTIQNNTITGNSVMYGGGGLSGCSGTIQNNLVAANSGHFGGGLDYCHGTIQNNTIAFNTAEYAGGGLYDCSGAIRNCIIWGNSAGEEGDQLYGGLVPTYSCIQGSTVGSEGNISRDPQFIDTAAGDYRLGADSPCIDVGIDFYWFGWPQRDVDGNCRLHGAGMDMGCYEYGSSTDADGDLLSDADESAAGTDPLRDDSDGDGLRDGLEVLRGSDPLASTAPTVVHVPYDVLRIQESLCLAVEGDEIVVAPGVHSENIFFFGCDVILRSENPRDLAVVASTIINGRRIGPAVSFTGFETRACVLSGFTVRGGKAQDGGGIAGNCTRATIENNTVIDNTAWEWGGGLYLCNGIIQNNIIAGNSADFGAGLCYCGGAIRNNLIMANLGYKGGGLHSCDGTIANNTIVGNSASGSIHSKGGGLRLCFGDIVSCIIWGNTDQLSESSMPAYSCVQDWTEGGEGNISDDPMFVDPRGPDDNPSAWQDNDYHLQPESPCIDAGSKQHWMQDAVDLDGNPRIFYGGHSVTVDMGAYEYGSWPFKVVDVIDTGGGGGLLMWNSRSTDTYTVWSCADLSSGTWVQEATISSKGDVSSWTDPAPLGQAKFYRVELK